MTDAQKKKRDRELAEQYEHLVGKPPDNRFFDDPDWLYRGTKAEREELRAKFAFVDDEPPVVIEGQASLLDE